MCASVISCSNQHSFGCLNHKGEFVDWWVIYKESGGERYIYKDTSPMDLRLSSERLISSEDSPLVRTVKSSGCKSPENMSKDQFYFAWNDQPSNKGSAPKEFAHAKVIIVCNDFSFLI